MNRDKMLAAIIAQSDLSDEMVQQLEAVASQWRKMAVEGWEVGNDPRLAELLRRVATMLCTWRNICECVEEMEGDW